MAKSAAIITVVRDRQQPLGKHFTLNPDGTVSKRASVNVALGMAVMHLVETHEELAELLVQVGNDPHAAIINASFKGIEVGEELVILSGREIESRLGIPESDRERQKGVHQIEIDGKTYKAVGRFKENVRASSWQILDRDIDIHTPAKFAALTATVHRGDCDTVDTAAIVLPDAKTIREITRKAGIEMSVKVGSNGLRIVSNDLTLATEIETKEYGTLTVRDMVERGITGKVRCQTPFRDSDSWAAFYNINADGIPFVYDSGTGITHWLSHFEQDEVKILPASAVVVKLVPKVIADSAAVLEDDAVQALAIIKHIRPPEYERKRAQLKQANKAVSLATMDRAVKARVNEMHVALTHHGYAKHLLAELTDGVWKPVGHQGGLYVVNPGNAVWERIPTERLIRLVAEAHDGKDNCEKSSDYRAVVEHATLLANDDSFFADGPTGMACPGGFYQIAGNSLTLVPLTPDHRQRVILPFTPQPIPTAEFEDFLHQTFKSDHEGEEQQQVSLLQEIAGGIMLGIIHRYHFAVLFYEPFGRAGKGTLEKQLRALVPKEFVSAISPFKWHHDYHVATLAGTFEVHGDEIWGRYSGPEGTNSVVKKKIP